MQYGGLRRSLACVTTSCSDDSFAFPTHRSNQLLDKGLWGVVPPLSPDLTPIELLWDELGRGFRHRQIPLETLQELRDALVHEWNNTPQAFIQQLIIISSLYFTAFNVP
jgi:hypothetical protein